MTGNQLTPEQALKLYKRKRIAIIVDIILIIVFIGLFIYIYSNIETIKKIGSGESHPCNICEKKYDAICTKKGFDIVYWSEESMKEGNKESSPYGRVLDEDSINSSWKLED